MIEISEHSPQQITIDPINDEEIESFLSEQGLQAKFDDFMSKFIATDIQNDIAFQITDRLIKSEASSPIRFERSNEDYEIIFVTENNQALNFISIDDAGDILVSHSPFFGDDGWREFFDYNNELDIESLVYKFLSL